MRLTKEQRIEKEESVIKDNNRLNSVCCGSFYISNRKETERCKNCDICSKYKRYEANKDKEPNVKFFYVDTFRKCELYKQKDNRDFSEVGSMVMAANDMFEQELIQEQANATVLRSVNYLDIMPNRVDAYMDIEKNHGKECTKITWGILFAIEVMFKFLEETMDVLQQSNLYKREVKRSFNKFLREYQMYKYYVRTQCYNNDYKPVIDEVDNMYMEVVKLRLCMENTLNKHKVKEAYVKSYLVLASELISWCIKVQFDLESIGKKYRKAFGLSNFMRPIILLKPIDEVILLLSKIYSNNATVDLNKDLNLITGLKVLSNIVCDEQRIANILINVAELNKRNGSKLRTNGRARESKQSS